MKAVISVLKWMGIGFFVLLAGFTVWVMARQNRTFNAHIFALQDCELEKVQFWDALKSRPGKDI